MEPDKKYINSFIEPLINQPGSRYRHTLMHGVHPRAYWDNYRQLYSDGKLLPPTSVVDKDDSSARQLDTDFLVTGNLARRFEASKHVNGVSFAEMILQQVIWAGLTNDLFHRRGRVRSLWWAPSTAHVGIHATMGTAFSFASYFGANVQTVASDSVDECGHTGGNRRRAISVNHGLARRDQEAVLSRMEHLGMAIPAGREPLWRKSTRNDDSHEWANPLEIRFHTIEAMAREIAECQALAKLAAKQKKAPGRKKADGADTATMWAGQTFHYPQCESLAHQWLLETSLHIRKNTILVKRAAAHLDLSLRVLNLEANWKEMQEVSKDTKNAATTTAQLEELLPRIMAINKHLNDEREVVFDIGTNLIEDQIARFAQPPNGAWHSRQFPPLYLDPKKSVYALHEFGTSTPLSLLDVTPRDVDLRVPGLATAAEVATTAGRLAAFLFAYRSLPLATALERIASNAGVDLVPQCPSVTDPRRGGRLDPNQVSVRMLTREMFEELLRAWFEWPFRPSYAELALTTENMSDRTPGEATTPEAVTGFIEDY